MTEFMERKLIKRPWIQNVLLSENPLPKKVKARVTWLNRQKNLDGTHSGEISDYVHKVNVVFSEEAVVECLEDRAHGHIFKHFTAIKGGAIVLTDYKVVPIFSEREFILLINHFKVLPGFIGSLAYTEKIPDNVRESKHVKEMKEKIQSLWEKQHANPGNDSADNLPHMTKDGSKASVTAEDQSLENNQTIHASSQNVSFAMNSQKEESRGSLTLMMDMADDVAKEQKEKEDMIELCQQYNPLENTDDLDIQDLLDRIHVAHTKYAPVCPQSSQSSSRDSETSQTIEIPTLNVSHAQTTSSSQSHEEMVSPEGTSLETKLVDMTKDDLIELCRNYQPLENADDLEIPDLLEVLHQAHIKYAPLSDSQSDSQSTNGDIETSEGIPTLNFSRSKTPSQSRHDSIETQTSDVTRSQTPSSSRSSNTISPRRLLDRTTNQIFNLTLSDGSQSSQENQSVTDASHLAHATGVAFLTAPAVSSGATGVTDTTGIAVTSQTLNDEKNCEDLPCSSRHLINRILNTTVSPDRTLVARPAMQLSQTPSKSQERQKRKKELWDFIGAYWKDKEKNMKLRKKQ